MDALQPSFMLLPNFAFLPDKNIHLGSILPQARNDKRPNPRQPLAAALPIVVDDISTQTFAPWKWNSGTSLSTSGGVSADLSIFTGIGAGFEAGRSSTSGLAIECESVVRTTFRPTPTSIAQAAADQTVTAILKKLSRPSVYIVTGLMVAHGARIEVSKGRGRTGGAHIGAGVSQTGVPINAGVRGDVGWSENSTLAQVPQEDFLLAYQLLRVRRKVRRGLYAVEENRWALFNDDGEDGGESEFLEEMDVDEVTEGFQWDDDDEDE